MNFICTSAARQQYLICILTPRFINDNMPAIQRVGIFVDLFTGTLQKAMIRVHGGCEAFVCIGSA